ncbi:TonB-dependent receptor [Paraburkholderia fungorum]|uniref:TonB-dependent siderophore receptor n=1 Tax=Paraburkholderia fungorum TaxID=134537 RepID=UPI0038BB987F
MPGTTHAQTAAVQPPSDLAGKDAAAKAPGAADASNSTAESAAPTAGASTATAIRRAQGVANSQSGSGAANGIPMTVNVVSRSAIDQQQPSDSYEALRGAAGISSSAGASVADNVSIRGIALEGRTSFRLNGALPINNFLAMPLEDKQAEEALKGAAALLFGIASPSGIVNLVTKRAGDTPNASIGISGTTNGEIVGSVDVGRRFGPDNQFGLRVNAAGGHLSSSINDVEGTRRFVSVAADWRPTNRLSFKLDFEDYERSFTEQSTIGLLSPVNGKITIPAVPDPNKLLSGDWATYRAQAQNILLRADYKVSDNWSVLAEGGRAETDRDARDLSTLMNYNPITGQGTLVTKLVRNQDYVNKYARVEANGKFNTGSLLQHHLTFGLMYNDRYQNNPSVQSVSTPQNLFNPVVLPAPVRTTPIVDLPQDSRDTGVYIYDAVTIANRLTVIGGMRRTDYSLTAQQATGPSTHFQTTNYSPAIGVTFLLRPDTSLYASYMTGLQETGLAPSTAVNAFQTLPPSVAKQKEVGIRSSALFGFNSTIAYFDINRGTAQLNNQNVFLIDGRSTYRGVEASIGGEVNRAWSFNVAGQYLHARTSGASNPALSGTQPENTPDFTLSMSVTYHPGILPGSSLTAGMFRTGAQAVNNANQAFIPAYTVYTLGAGYTTRIAGHRTTLALNVNNLANDRHYSAAGNGLLIVGPARSIRFSARTDF